MHLLMMMMVGMTFDHVSVYNVARFIEQVIRLSSIWRYCYAFCLIADNEKFGI
jgi:hypothetical protein